MTLRVLIVDDHPTVLEALRMVFNAAGINDLTECESVEKTLTAIAEKSFDVVVLDLALGNEDGLKVLRKVNDSRQPVPVLIHSFHDNPRLLWHSYTLGAVGYVVKGLDKNILIHAVQQAAAGAQVWTSKQLAQVREVMIVSDELN